MKNVKTLNPHSPPKDARPRKGLFARDAPIFAARKESHAWFEI